MRTRQAAQTGRRVWLITALALLVSGLPELVRAAEEDAGHWLPDGPSGKLLLPERTRVIEPRITERELLPQDGKRAFRGAQRSQTRTVGVAPKLTRPPTAYVLTAARTGVPAWVMFGVALQESQLLFGHETLPWPWTLDVAGRAERHDSYTAMRDALAGYLRAGVTNIDCGAMQVNWGAHSGLLCSPVRACDPYFNLAAGASILKQGYASTGSWPQAVGLYHTGSFRGDERRWRAVRYVAGVSRRLSRHGLTLAQAAAIPADAVQLRAALKPNQERRDG